MDSLGPARMYDDEELLSLLLSKSAQEENLCQRLEGLKGRFLRNWLSDPVSEGWWSDLVATTRAHGFIEEDPVSVRIPEEKLLENIAPASFETSGGKEHLQVTAEFLGVTEASALQLTLGALASLATSNDDFQSLLGTRALLLKTMEYYHQQRVSQIGVLAECLLIEQDHESATSGMVASLLNDIDEQYILQGNRRGLFRFLLYTATQSLESFSREQLEKTRNLAPPVAKLHQSAMTPTDRNVWNQFLVDSTQIRRVFMHREQVEAMEALVVLLYKRIENGVQRKDLLQILLSFNSCGHFFTADENDLPSSGFQRRASMLAALICSECTALWRALLPGTPWVQDHPLLSGLPEAQPEKEVEVLISVLKTIMHESRKRESGRQSGNSGLDIPQSVGGLSFGMLLRLAGSATEGWSRVKEAGSTMVEDSNECDAFGYIYNAMNRLVDKASIGSSTRAPIYVPVELTAKGLIYASIGRELLSTTIFSMREVLADPLSPATAENINLFCNIAAVVNHNSPMMSDQFWADWEAHVGHSQTSYGHNGTALCLLMEAAYLRATKTIEEPVGNEAVLAAVAPFLRIVSSFVYSPGMVEAAVSSFFQDGLLSQALRAASSGGESRRFREYRDSFMDSISNLCTISRSSSASDLLRNMFENGDMGQPTAPRLLLRVAASSTEKCCAGALQSLAQLILDEPTWAVAAAIEIEDMMTKDGSWNCVVERGSSAAPLFLGQVCKCMNIVAFSDYLDDKGICQFIRVLKDAVAVCALRLPSLRPSYRSLSSRRVPSFELATTILTCISNALDFSGPIVQLHQSATVRTAASDLQKSLVRLLVTRAGLADSILDLAVCPVSLSLARKLASARRDFKIVETMNTVGRRSSSDVLSGKTGVVWPSDGNNWEQELVCDCLRNPDMLSFDFSDDPLLSEVGEDPLSPLNTALGSFGLLTSWSRVAECLGTDVCGPDGFVSLSPFHILSLPLGFSASDGELRTGATGSTELAYLSLFSRYIAGSSGIPLEGRLCRKACEFLLTCLLHGKKVISFGLLQGDVIFKSLFQADLVHDMLRLQVRSAILRVGTDQKIEDDDTEQVSFDILTLCCAVNPSLASKATAVGTHGSCIENTLEALKSLLKSILDQFSNGTLEIRKGSPTARDLRVACRCLDVWRSTWKWTRQPTTLSPRASKELSLDMDLLSLLLSVVRCVIVGRPDFATDPSSLACLRMTTLAFDVAAWELSYADTDEQRKTQLANTISNVFEDDLSALVSLLESCADVRSIMPLVTSFSSFCDDISVSSAKPQQFDQLMDSLLVTSTLHLENLLVDSSPVVDKFAELWLSSLAPTTEVHHNMTQNWKQMKQWRILLSSEMALLSSIRSFTVLLCESEKSFWRGTNRQSNILSISMVHQSLVTLKKCLDAAEGTSCKDLLRERLPDVVSLLSSLPVHFVPTCQEDAGHHNGVEPSIQFALACCDTILGSPFLSLVSLKHLLATVSALLKYSDVVTEGNLRLGVIGVTCKAIARLESVSIPFNAKPDDILVEEAFTCLSISISLLATSLYRGNDNDALFSDKVFRLLRESNLVGSLARLCCYPAGKPSSVLNEIMVLSLNLFSEVAVCGGANMLRLLLTDDVAVILSRRAQFTLHNLNEFPMRGYKRLKSAPGGERGRTNPSHLVWRACLKFLSASLRSSSEVADAETLAGFVKLSVDFLRVNSASVSSCLNQCSDISLEMKFPVITMNVIEEAGLIMSLASELCSCDAVFPLIGEDPKLMESLLTHARSLVPSLSNYLGCSASSRELFRSIEEFNPTNLMALDPVPQLNSFSPRYCIFTAGSAQATHEAIRFSHYVTVWSTPVTKDEDSARAKFPARWNPLQRERSPSDPHSLSSLERKCREAVTNCFALKLEYEVARTLFFSLDVLMKRHPAASCFVMFSREEVQSLDAMCLAQPGCCIAFRRTPYEEGTTLRYGQVIRADTVHRRWLVAVTDTNNDYESENNHVVVSVEQLAGIEDRSKRRHVLSFGQAPSAPSHLDCQTPSIGHLLFVLRWCCQFFEELQDRNLDITAGESGARRLAEIAISFLAAETLLMEESNGTKKTNPISPPKRMELALQVLDLLGDDREFGTFIKGIPSPLPVALGGRLQTVLSKDCWKRARSQLHEQLIIASKSTTHPTMSHNRPSIPPGKQIQLLSSSIM